MANHASFDVVIIGARIAGSVLAARLGDAGCRVLLVDRATFPSPTLSTHFFRGGQALAVMQELGLLDELLATGAPKLERGYLYTYAGACEMRVDPPQDPGEIGYAMSVRRVTLDAILARRAATTPSVELLERTRLIELLHEGERVIGARLATPVGERIVHARIVVGADGRHSAVAGAVRPAIESSAPAYRALYFAYMRDFPGPGGADPDGPEFSFLEDEMAAVFPSDAGLACVGISINLEAFATLRLDIEAGFRERISHHAGLAQRFQAATREGRLFGCPPEPSWVRVPTGPGWALVGDAGLHQDPWSGQGIDCASRHASFLADALFDWFAGREREADALGAYHARRNDHGLERYRQTIAFAPDLRGLAGDPEPG